MSDSGGLPQLTQVSAQTQTQNRPHTFAFDSVTRKQNKKTPRVFSPAAREADRGLQVLPAGDGLQ